MFWRSCLLAGFLACLICPAASAANLPQTRPSTVSKTKVLCEPAQPRSNQPVVISVFPQNPIRNAQIQYQLVEPGQYINYADEAYLKKWTSLPMSQTGDHFSVTLPSTLQVHRRLVRYRFNFDGAILPEKKGAPGNFAYFCFDGIGSWKAAIEPGSIAPDRAKVVEYDATVMNSIQPLILISKNKDVEDCTWKLKDRSGLEWAGTVVYNGKVYDHVTYRARGGIWRYDLGKNMWKIDFDKDNPLALLDDYGAPFAAPRDDLDLNPLVQQAGIGFRGEHGMFESTGFKLFQLAGVPASHTTFLQFRIIDSPDETGQKQSDGDLWGLYLAIENPDSRFIQQHNLPKGNLYKMERGTGPGGGELKAKSPTLPNDNSDLVDFTSKLSNSKPRSLLASILAGSAKTNSQWVRENIDLPEYYSYRAIVEMLHHYDISQGKNFYYFHNPDDKLWSVIPWDLDITWEHNQWGDGQDPFKVAFLDRPEFAVEYRNRMRELRDLLFNPDQMNRLIDSYAALIYTPGKPSFVDVDRALWDYHPMMNNTAHHAKPGIYYRKSITPPGGFAGMLVHMKRYVEIRSKWIDATILGADTPPTTPVVKYIGPTNFSKDNLQFSCSPFQSPDNVAFAAIQWRIAKIDVDDPAIKRPDRAYEITPTWQSEELKDFTETFKIPGGALKQGETYRVRAKIKDTNGVWSHWSDPIQFQLQ